MDLLISLCFRGTCPKHFSERLTVWQWSSFLLYWMVLDPCKEIKILYHTWSWKCCLYLQCFVFSAVSAVAVHTSGHSCIFSQTIPSNGKVHKEALALYLVFVGFVSLFLTPTIYDFLAYTSWRAITENS